VPYKSRELCYIDFEFSTELTKSWKPRLICVSWKTPGELKNYWLMDSDLTAIRETLQEVVDTYTLVAHFAIAEILCLEAMGVDLSSVQVIDTHAEWTQLCNRFDYNWGKQLQDGKKVVTRPPVDKEEKDRLQELSDSGRIAKQNYGDAAKGLASFVYKFTKETLDTEHKKAMQQLCIDYDKDALNINKQTVLKYCDSDVEYLAKAYTQMRLKGKDVDAILGSEEMAVERGYFTSVLQLSLYKHGIPVDRQALTNLSECTDAITQVIKEQLNKDTNMSFFRDHKVIKINKKTGKPTKTSIQKVGSEDQQVIQEYIKLRYPQWPKTKKGSFSTEANILELYRFDNVVEQYFQARKSLRSINSLNPCKSDGSEKDSYLLTNVDRDGYLRNFFGCFGTQTGRNAPRASIFLLAMSKWIRSFLKPPAGYSIVECDYSSQESLLAGIIYEDQDIINSYISGDPYLAFGRLAGMIPEGYDKAMTEKKFPGLRAKLKAVVLGKSYGMGVKALGAFLAAQTWKGASSPGKFQREWEEHCENSMDEAAELDREYKDAYPDMHDNREETWQDFEAGEILKISRDWTIGKHVFKLSLLNAPVQGLGARIMRTFSHYLLTRDNPYGVRYFSPLHDASFSLVPNDYLVEGCEWIKGCMMDAVTREVLHPSAKEMRVGFTIISPELAGQKINVGGQEIDIHELLLETPSCKEIREGLKPYWSVSSEDW